MTTTRLPDHERMMAVQALELSKNYGSFQVLSKLNLLIQTGTIYGLIGPNGSGKTTTVRILCGLIRPSYGSCFIFGRRVPDEIPRWMIGYMPQGLGLYRPDSASEYSFLWKYVRNSEECLERKGGTASFFGRINQVERCNCLEAKWWHAEESVASMHPGSQTQAMPT